MKDLLGLMGKAKEMQAKFQAMQDEIATLEATGQAGGGLVSVTLTGKFEMKSLKIDPSLFKEDEVEILEDLLLAAHNDAKAKVEQIMQEKTKALTAGLADTAGNEAAVLNDWRLKRVAFKRIHATYFTFLFYACRYRKTAAHFCATCNS